MGSFISKEEKKHIINSLRSSVPATRFLVLKKLAELAENEPEKLRGLSSSSGHTLADILSSITYMGENDRDEHIRREASITLEKIKSVLEPKLVVPVTYCSECKGFVDIGWNYCPSCATPPASSKFPISKCNECGGFIKETWSYCVHCKAPLQAHKRETRCPNCKRVMDKSWGTCPYCGSTIKTHDRASAL